MDRIFRIKPKTLNRLGFDATLDFQLRIAEID
jgi:hypothetical protein